MPSCAAFWTVAVLNIILHQFSAQCSIGMSLDKSRGDTQHAAPEASVRLPHSHRSSQSFTSVNDVYSMLLMFCTHPFAQPVTMYEFCKPFTMYFETSPTVSTFIRPVTIIVETFNFFIQPFTLALTNCRCMGRFIKNFRTSDSSTTFHVSGPLAMIGTLQGISHATVFG